ncbi:MAG: serine/threonine-protein kinase [Jaaginema sp. PMC 1079.18]|nr:serine/threonine-protein kinase [Jaaginema sp. PMC 1080.18]MEC4850188.1 serine/threonine-protein kinase [Jaaginema sp. PMC 1079.18]MEC4865299.1 serine/threonine-protein kinase [Jaaginema sp. PMC 1078.18]
MSYCLNSHCPQPQKAGEGRFCIHCGTSLLLGDRFRAIQPVSEGGMGRTFVGIDTQATPPQTCAIKQITPTQKGQNRDFFKEAQRLQGISQHPQIPDLLAYFESENGMPTLVQEWIEGENIDRGIYTEAEIRQLFDDTLPLLHFIHEHNLIHRDINPQNLIRPTVSRADAPLFLVDFSTAKVTTKTALAKTGTMLGSAAYTAPEQLRGKAICSSDLYSLGLIAVHLLTGMHPFELFGSAEGLAVWEDYLTGEVSGSLRGIINRAVADSPRDRFLSAAEMYEALHPGEGIPTQLEIPFSPTTNPNAEETTLIPAWRCFRTLTGHRSSVEAIAFSPDNTRIGTTGADRIVRIWDLQTQEAHHTQLKTHFSIVSGIAWFDKFLISSSWDYKICIWETETSAKVRELTGHSAWIQSLTISPDGTLLASGSADGNIKLWDWQRGVEKLSFANEREAILSLVFERRGEILVSGNAKGKIGFWEGKTGEQLSEIAAHPEAIHSLAFSPSNQLLLSASGDRTIKIWQWQSQTLLQTLTGHEGEVYAIALNQNGNLLASGSADKTVKLWHPGSGRLLQSLNNHEGGVKAVTWNGDATILATGSQDKTVKLWRFR